MGKALLTNRVHFRVTTDDFYHVEPPRPILVLENMYLPRIRISVFRGYYKVDQRAAAETYPGRNCAQRYIAISNIQGGGTVMTVPKLKDTVGSLRLTCFGSPCFYLLIQLV